MKAAARILGVLLACLAILALTAPSSGHAADRVPEPGLDLRGVTVVRAADVVAVHAGDRDYRARGFVYRMETGYGVLYWPSFAATGITRVEDRTGSVAIGAVREGRLADLEFTPAGRAWAVVFGVKVYLPWPTRVVLR